MLDTGKSVPPRITHGEEWRGYKGMIKNIKLGLERWLSG